jgi:hypothetical protein
MLKYLKIIGLVAVAAMAMMAFAGSASATVLCNNNLSTTACSSKVAAGTLIESSLTGSSVLKSGETTLNTCTGGKFTSEVSNAGSSTTTVSGPNKTIDFEGCVSTVHTKSSCEFCEHVANGTLEIHHIAGTDNGTVTASGVVITNTIFGTSCIYQSGVGKDLGTLVGGNPASLNINITVTELTPKAICPDTPTWTATFKVTSPTPLYVAAA